MAEQLDWNTLFDVAPDAASPTLKSGSLEEIEARDPGFVVLQLPNFRDTDNIGREFDDVYVQFV